MSLPGDTDADLRLVNRAAGDGVFDIVTVPIGDYERHPSLEADHEAQLVAELFVVLGGRLNAWEVAADEARTVTVVDRRLRSWSDPPASRNSVLFWVGHGEANPDGAWLATYETPESMDEGGVMPGKLAGFIGAEWRRRAGDSESWTIVVIEACGAERFANLLHSELLRQPQPPSRFAVIGVGAPDGVGHLGEFRQAMGEALASYTDCDDTIALHDLLRQLDERLTFGIVHNVRLNRVPPLVRARRLPAPVAAAMDVYAEIQRFVTTLSPDERLHFLPKAQGADQAELGQPAWYFVGRSEERSQIAGWLRAHAQGMLVVTGRAGSGKSALLGHVLVHSTPGLRDPLITSGLLKAAPEGEFPDDLRFDAVIHLTGTTVAELVTRLAAAVEIDYHAGLELGGNIERILQALAERRRPFTVLVDALDEAQSPITVAGAVLRRLSALDGVRIVVGTRTSTEEGPDLPEPENEDILDALGPEADRILVRRDPDAVARYVVQRLSAARRSTDLDISDATITDVAEQIRARNQHFLYARLAVHELIADPAVLSPSRRADLVELLSGDHRALFAAAVERLAGAHPATRPLLQALALAAGRGLPRIDRTWVTVANALHDGPAVSEQDIDNLLLAAAPYVMVDAEHGQSVFRLTHRTFAEHFLGGSIESPLAEQHRLITAALTVTASRALPNAPNAYLVFHLANHAGEANAWDLLADTPQLLDHLDPAVLAAEVLRTAFGRPDLPPQISGILRAQHLLGLLPVEHREPVRAIATARLTGVATMDDDRRPGAVAAKWLDSPSFSSYIVGRDWRPKDERWAGRRSVLLGHIRNRTPGSRVAELHATVLGPLRAGPVRAIRPSRTMPWARMQYESLHVVLVGHRGPVNVLCAVQLQEGRTLLASAGDDTTVRLWAPTAAASVGEPMLGHTAPVHALAAVPLPDGRTLLASAGDDRTVRLWDPLTATAVGEPMHGHTAPVRALAAVPLPDGRTLLASAGDDRTVRLWDPLTATVVGEPLIGAEGPLDALAALPFPDGRTFLITYGKGPFHRSVLHIRDPLTGEPANDIPGALGPLFIQVRSLATITLTDGQQALAVIGTFIGWTALIWEPATGMVTDVDEPGRGHITSAKADRAFVVPMLGRRALLVVARGAKLNLQSVTLGDPEAGRTAGSGRPATEHLVGCTSEVRAVTDVSLDDGRTLLATAEADGQVRIWSLGEEAFASLPTGPMIGVPAATTPREQVVDELATAVSDIAFVPAAGPGGPALLATVGRDELVRLWNASDGTLTGTRVRVQTGKLTWFTDSAAVAAVMLPGGRHLLAAGSGRTVQLLDPVTGDVHGRPGRTAQTPRLLPLGMAVGWNAFRLDGSSGRKTAPVTALASVHAADRPTILGVAAGRSVLTFQVSERGLHDRRHGTQHDGRVRVLTSLSVADGRQLFASGGDDHAVRLIDALTATPVTELSGHSGPVLALCPVPLSDGRTLLASGGADQDILLWDPVTGRPAADPLRGHRAPVEALTTISLPGRVTLLVSCDAETICGWDPLTGVLEFALPGTGATALASDGGILYSASHLGLFALNVDSLVRHRLVTP